MKGRGKLAERRVDGLDKIEVKDGVGEILADLSRDKLLARARR